MKGLLLPMCRCSRSLPPPPAALGCHACDCPERHPGTKLGRESLFARTRWDGTSFLPLLASPRTKYWKNATFSQYQRCGAAADGFTFEVTNPCEFVKPADFTYIGHSIRTDESSSLGAWRYTLWLEWDGTALRPKWNAAVGEELYHHRGDTEPDIDVRFEQANLAGDDALVSTKMALREALLAQVRA